MLPLAKSKIFIAPLVSFLLLNFTSCCKHPRLQLSRPAQVEGWRDSYENTTHFIGELVLKKGESSDNGKVGVRIVEIIKPEIQCGLMAERSEPEITLQLFDPATKEILCEKTTTTGNSYLKCDPRADVSVIGVKAINYNEGWVWFDLRE
jgi:hypothetical protein